MKGTDFIEMMRQDIATEGANKHNLEAVIECMAAVVAANPGCDIQEDGTKPKTPQGCYKYLEDNARKNTQSAAYFMGPQESLKLVAKYLGLDAGEAPAAVIPKQSKIISLDDLI